MPKALGILGGVHVAGLSQADRPRCGVGHFHRRMFGRVDGDHGPGVRRARIDGPGVDGPGVDGPREPGGQRLQGLCRLRHGRPGRQGLQRPGQEGPGRCQGPGLRHRLQRGTGRDGLRREHPAPDRRGLPDDHHGRLQPGAGDGRGHAGQHRTSPSRQVDATWDESTNGKTPANFTGLDFQIDEAATLAGYLVAGVSKSGIIGTYGGQQFPGVTAVHGRPLRGHRPSTTRRTAPPSSSSAGTPRSRPAPSSAATTPGATPPRASSSRRPSSTRAPTSSVRSPAPRATARSRRCRPPDKWAIGVDTDQALSLPEYAQGDPDLREKVIDVAVLETIKKNAGGDMGGENFVGTLANGGVALVPVPRPRLDGPRGPEGRG